MGCARRIVASVARRCGGREGWGARDGSWRQWPAVVEAARGGMRETDLGVSGPAVAEPCALIDLVFGQQLCCNDLDLSTAHFICEFMRQWDLLARKSSPNGNLQIHTRIQSFECCSID